jgi:hypothetical protein
MKKNQIAKQKSFVRLFKHLQFIDNSMIHNQFDTDSKKKIKN